MDNLVRHSRSSGPGFEPVTPRGPRAGRKDRCADFDAVPKYPTLPGEPISPDTRRPPESPMTTTPKCEVKGDAARNLIRISYRGHVAAAEMKACADQAKALLPSMRPGFTILTDLSGLDSMELVCVSELSKMMEACKAKGVGTVVRIVPDPAKDIGFNILSVIHYRRGVHVVTCQNTTEAERAI